MTIIDLRSDTVTQPTMEMRRSIFHAVMGDDVYEEDKTINQLQEKVAKMFHKEAALFFPSGTMSNLTASLIWCDKRGSEIILGDKSHMFLYEQGGAAQFGGISYRCLPNVEDGTMNLDQIKLSIRDNDIHETTTQLIAVENTHNVCGGKILSIDYLKKLAEISEQHKIPVHMDGARIWNALTAMDLINKPYEISQYVQSLSVCLSKGLGAPVGSLLVGPREFIQKAKRIRKALGGGMRQSGLLAAAGLRAIDDFENGILKTDHSNALQIVTSLRNIDCFKIKETIDSNIVFIEIDNTKTILTAHDIAEKLKVYNILVSAWSPYLLRIVLHRDIKYYYIGKIVDAFYLSIKG